MANNVSLMLFMGEKVIRICDPHASFGILNLRPQLPHMHVYGLCGRTR